MASIIWLMGLLTAGLGCWAVWNPKLMTRLLGWFQKEFLFYLTIVIKAAFGIIMLVWAHACNKPGVIIALGIITLVGSIASLIAPRTQSKKFIAYILRQPLWIYRTWGLLAIALGALIIWAGWLK